MNAIALTVLLGSVCPAQAPRLENLEFGGGTLAGWRGHGFYVTTADPRGPSTSLGVCSSDRGLPGRTGALRYTFVVPPAAGLLRCSACAARPGGASADDRLDVLLVTDRSQVVPKKVKGPAGWEPAAGLLPRQGGRAREYGWDLEPLAGRRVQIILLDNDPRPGCHLFCSGFRLSFVKKSEEAEFAEQVRRVERQKDLPPLARFESKHFVAWSNADGAFTRGRLRNCELIYQFFFEHFGRRGFAVRPPASKLLVAVFDSQAGFQAYLDHPMPIAVTGIYNRATNQLVVYDLSQNDRLVANRQKALDASRTLRSDLDRLRYLETTDRRLAEWSQDGSLSAAMHETAHQLSFNCGLLRRDGDVPAWLSEGLACYCEATAGGAWQGIGEFNPGRAADLAAAVGRGRPFLRLRDLIEKDDWRLDGRAAGLGYAQSWALFRFLMRERPAALRAYLELLAPRRASDHRLADFGQAIGADLSGLEQRYFDYLREVARKAPPRR
jgi:hypothetical protein